MTITNKNTEKSSLTGSGSAYTLDYGTVKQGTNGDVNIEVASEISITNFRAQTSCGGCTKADSSKIDDKNYKVKINYKTTLLGNINRNVYIYTIKEGEKGQNKITINLKGNVVK